MNKKIANKKREQAGFSLIELSVVLVIVGILIYMTLEVTAAQMEMGKIKSTQEKLAKIQTALVVYYQVNGRLPCPADGSLPTSGSNTYGSSVNFGKEIATIPTAGSFNDVTCAGNPIGVLANSVTSSLITVYAGVIPTRSLGLSDDLIVDAWGKRITYIVSKYCVDADNWNSANTYKCSDQSTALGTGSTTTSGGRITITGKNGQTWPTSSPDLRAAYAIISHGKDGLGGYPRIGGQKSTGASDSIYETTNGNLLVTLGTALTLSGSNFYDIPISDGTIPANYFDDLVVWRTAAQIDYNANH